MNGEKDGFQLPASTIEKTFRLNVQIDFTPFVYKRGLPRERSSRVTLEKLDAEENFMF